MSNLLAGDQVLVIGTGPAASVLEGILRAAGARVRVASPHTLAGEELGETKVDDVVVVADAMGETGWRARLPASLPVLTVLPSGALADSLPDGDRGIDDVLRRPFTDGELLARTQRAVLVGRRVARLEAQRERLNGAIESFKRITGTLDSRQVLSIIVSEVARVTAAARSSIVLIDQDRMVGTVLATFEDPSITGLKLDLCKYPEILHALETKRTVAIEDLAANPLTASVRNLVSSFENVSVMVVPIIWEQEVLGTLFLRASRARHPFTADDIDYCELVAGAALNAIRNAELFRNAELESQRLKTLAITDQLTGTYNQGYLRARLQEEYERSVRYESHFSFIMFDVDDFKRVNDTLGHLVGDGVLRELADQVRNSIRRPDIIARYGGEEFAVLLPNTALAGGVREAERLRAMVAQWQFADMPVGQRITISLGVSTFPSPAVKGPVDLIANADTALYAAKRAGKNQVREHPVSEW